MRQIKIKNANTNYEHDPYIRQDAIRQRNFAFEYKRK